MDIEAMHGELTLREKASLLAGASHWSTAGIERLGIPSITVSDGPHGLRHQTGAADHLGLNQSLPATCFPTASALACSFDPALVADVGVALAEEARSQGVDVVLGPGVNMKRSPLCGRNFEYFSEDPYLAGVLGSAMVRSIQEHGVGACVKHFAANNQEHARLVSDSVVDEQALREIYLAPFERIVREARPWSIMTGYNKLNGVYCSEHRWLLDEVLRGEWGFDGVCVSDWGAMSDGVASVRAGLDLCMPGPRPDHVAAIEGAVRAGELDESVLDDAARRMLRFAERASRGRPAGAAGSGAAAARAHARALAVSRRAATESAVLLKNEGALPLDPSMRVAVIGAFAKEPRYQGAGSSKINPVALDCAWDALLELGVDAAYSSGYDPRTGDASELQLVQAAELAASCDAAIVFAGLPDRYESEGFDRKLMCMPRGQRDLIARVAAANPRTIVVLQGGAPMELPWRDDAAAILLMYLSGCQGGHAAADLLLGRVSPSGKLAETWPVELEDTPLGSDYPDFDREVLYREGIFSGYRYYDAAGVEPAYPFGHGLSYGTFEIADAAVDADGGSIAVRCRVANTGDARASEVVQVYLEMPPSPYPRERRRLAGFQKVDVGPGETRVVEVELDEYALRCWNPARHEWELPVGSYGVLIGSSSRDIRTRCSFEYAGAPEPSSPGPNGPAAEPASVAPGPNDTPALETPAEYLEVRPHGFSRQSFERLYGAPLPPRTPVAPFTIDSSASEMASTRFGRFVFHVVAHVLKDPVGKMDRDTRVMMNEIVADTPLRSLLLSGFSMRTVEGLVDMLNGRYVRGAKRMLGTLVRLKRTVRELGK